MKTLRRYIQTDATFFITIVTYERRPILGRQASLVMSSWPVPLLAWAVMPEHIHVILNTKSRPISRIVHEFKIRFSRLYRNRYGLGRVWQNRYWDRVIRNELELSRYLDYIHYNPVHHELVANPHVYKHSSLAVWRENGFYAKEWGTTGLMFEGDFGE